jgi:hypothetical protein
MSNNIAAPELNLPKNGCLRAIYPKRIRPQDVVSAILQGVKSYVREIKDWEEKNKNSPRDDLKDHIEALAKSIEAADYAEQQAFAPLAVLMGYGGGIAAVGVATIANGFKQKIDASSYGAIVVIGGVLIICIGIWQSRVKENKYLESSITAEIIRKAAAKVWP